MRARGTWGLTAMLLVSVVSPWSETGAAVGPPVAAEGGAAQELVQQPQGGTCLQRTDALRRYLAAPGDRLGALRRQATTHDEVKEGAEPILDFLAEAAQLRPIFESDWPQRFAQAARTADPVARATALEATATDLYAVAAAPQEPVLRQLLAARALAFFAVRLGGVDAPWTGKLLRLLEAPDARSRLVGALVIAEGRLREDQAVEKRQVIPELIAGLSGVSFAERYYAAEALTSLTGLNTEPLCVDPTAPPQPRAPGVMAWEHWWSANKDAIGHEWIPGKW
jgi:hypothetical protein